MKRKIILTLFLLNTLAGIIACTKIYNAEPRPADRTVKEQVDQLEGWERGTGNCQKEN